MFVAVGALLFALDAVRRRAEPERIVVSAAQVARLAEAWRAQAGRAPTDAELEALVREHVDEEVQVREALRLGLGEGDPIVRRRLAQKLRFLSDDLEPSDPPDEATLRAHWAAHPERWRQPARVSFEHVYWSEGDAAEQEARAALESAELETRWRELGEPSMLRRQHRERSLERVARDFGAGFAAALAEAPVGEWSGPVRSAHGVHLVRVSARRGSFVPAFEDIAARVREDLEAGRRDAAARARLAAWRERYRVEVER